MPKFQQRHYEDIAKVIADNYQCIPNSSYSLLEQIQVEHTFIRLTNDLVWLFSNDNPHFKPDKFRKACGIEG